MTDLFVFFCFVCLSVLDDRPFVTADFLDSRMASIPACHSGDLGSVPRQGSGLYVPKNVFVSVGFGIMDKYLVCIEVLPLVSLKIR